VSGEGDAFFVWRELLEHQPMFGDRRPGLVGAWTTATTTTHRHLLGHHLDLRHMPRQLGYELVAT